MKGLYRIVLLCALAASASSARLIASVAADPDETPPSISGVDVHSDWIIEVEFSEHLTSTSAENRDNYTIFASDHSTTQIEFAEYVHSSRSVYLILKYALRQKEQYKVVCRNISDQAGNVMGYGEMGFLPIDRTPPWLLSVVTLDSLNVAVLFDEDVDPETSTQTWNYSVFKTEAQLESIPVTSVSTLTPRKIWISLASKMHSGTSYTLRAVDVEDVSGISIPHPGMTSEIAFPDDDPPYVALVRQVVSCVPLRLEILFNEPVDPGHIEDIDNYCLFSTGSPLETVPLSHFITCSGDGEWVYLAMEEKLDPGSPYTLALSQLRDLAGNLVPAGYEFEFRTEASPEPIYDVEYRTMAGEVEISWQLVEGSQLPGFTVLRAPGRSDSFNALPGGGLSIFGFEYSYTDYSIEYGKSYRYRVQYDLGEGPRILFETSEISTPGLTFRLNQNYPNPFNPATLISWQQPVGGDVLLEVFDLGGRKVAIVERGYRDAGDQHAEWDGRGAGGERLSSGVYFYRIEMEGEIRTKKMILLR